jgi:hypothetical protein
MVLECAKAAGSDYIVTFDKDLLRLGNFENMIISPAAGPSLEWDEDGTGRLHRHTEFNACTIWSHSLKLGAGIFAYRDSARFSEFRIETEALSVHPHQFACIGLVDGQPEPKAEIVLAVAGTAVIPKIEARA